MYFYQKFRDRHLVQNIYLLHHFLLPVNGKLYLFAVSDSASGKFLIGFSQCTTADEWRKTMDLEMKNELIYYPGVELLIRDAGNNSNKQVNDIRELLAEGIDLLIVSPNESKPLTGIVSEVFRAGIPVIVIDRKIESGDYTAFIGANNVQVGREAGRYAVNLLKGKGRFCRNMGIKRLIASQRQARWISAIYFNRPGIYINIQGQVNGSFQEGKK